VAWRRVGRVIIFVSGGHEDVDRAKGFVIVLLGEVSVGLTIIE
jgi:hypothetical protein